MKIIYNAFCGLLVMLLLVIGCVSLVDQDATFSQLEERQLKTFPRFTVSGFLSGMFQQELDAYYADTFPGRESLLEADGVVSAFFDFSDLILGETE